MFGLVRLCVEDSHLHGALKVSLSEERLHRIADLVHLCFETTPRRTMENTFKQRWTNSARNSVKNLPKFRNYLSTPAENLLYRMYKLQGE